MAGALAEIRTGVVGDVTAGRGSLLDAAGKRVGAPVGDVGTGVDPAVVRFLRRERPNWTSGLCNILSPVSRRASRCLKGLRFKAVLLNPPFSYRGSQSRPVLFGDAEYRSSPAAAFVAAAMSLLAM